VQAIRASVGGKVNDVVLSVVVRAVSRYIRLHGEKVSGRYLRVVCPVNLRGDEQGESLGNRITFLPVVLPLDVRDPLDMLRATAARMEVMKNVRAAELVAIAGSCLGASPAPMQELFWQGLPTIALPLPLLNIICTNVPGSRTPLYAAGRRLLASYPQVPTGYELGLGVAVQSYDGKLFFGLTADAHVAPDVGRLREYIRLCFEELCVAAGIRAPQPAVKPQPTAKPRPAVKPKAAKARAPKQKAAAAPAQTRRRVTAAPSAKPKPAPDLKSKGEPGETGTSAATVVEPVPIPPVTDVPVPQPIPTPAVAAAHAAGD